MMSNDEYKQADKNKKNKKETYFLNKFNIRDISVNHQMINCFIKINQIKYIKLIGQIQNRS